jgi:hypothetical protein
MDIDTDTDTDTDTDIDTDTDMETDSDSDTGIGQIQRTHTVVDGRKSPRKAPDGVYLPESPTPPMDIHTIGQWPGQI